MDICFELLGNKVSHVELDLQSVSRQLALLQAFIRHKFQEEFKGFVESYEGCHNNVFPNIPETSPAASVPVNHGPRIPTTRRKHSPQNNNNKNQKKSGPFHGITSTSTANKANLKSSVIAPSLSVSVVTTMRRNDDQLSRKNLPRLSSGSVSNATGRNAADNATKGIIHEEIPNSNTNIQLDQILGSGGEDGEEESRDIPNYEFFDEEDAHEFQPCRLNEFEEPIFSEDRKIPFPLPVTVTVTEDNESSVGGDPLLSSEAGTSDSTETRNAGVRSSASVSSRKSTSALHERESATKQEVQVKPRTRDLRLRVNPKRKIQREVGNIEGSSISMTNTTVQDRNTTGERLKCSVCHKTFVTFPCLRRHKRTVHVREKQFKCFCSKSFTRNDSLLLHQRRIHK